MLIQRVVLIDSSILDLEAYPSTKEIAIELNPDLDQSMREVLINKLVDLIVAEREEKLGLNQGYMVENSLRKQYRDINQANIKILKISEFIKYVENTDMFSEPSYMLTLTIKLI